MSKITYEGKQYEIPKKNMEIVRAEDVCNAYHATHEEVYKAKFEYLKAVFTDEQIEQMLGSTDIESVDVMEVVYIVNLVDEEYNKRIDDTQMKKAQSIMNSKPIQDLIKAGNAVSKISEKK